ncbi:hypothetical protein [Staphylococcus saprophyticus]|uniref:hypothetical protein n=1 Tax=Staphylococcus saprophyticus TaxID=29385 RepID=UPI0038227D4F
MIGLIANIVMFIAWAFVMYKWIKAEKKVKELSQDKHGLQLEKLQLEREMSWLKNKDNEEQGTYVVEVNKDIFLRKIHIPKNMEIANRFSGIYFTFTGLNQASIFASLNDARVYARRCGGRVLQHKPNLEVVE